MYKINYKIGVLNVQMCKIRVVVIDYKVSCLTYILATV